MKFIKIALLAFTGFACARAVPAPIPASVVEEACSEVPTIYMGLPLVESREEDEGQMRGMAVFGARMTDGTIVAILMRRDGCHTSWYVADTKVIEQPCPPTECI